MDLQVDGEVPQFPFEHVSEDASLKGQFYAHDSFGV
jgi:hypothetical protein